MKGRRKHILLPTIICTSLVWPSTVLAKTVYQYIDQQGAVAFSDHPPEHTNSYVVLDIPDPPPPDPEETEKQLDEMIATADKLEAKRKEDEAKENTVKTPEAEERALSEESYDAAPEDNENRGYYDFYPGYYGDFPFRQRSTPPYRDSEPDNPGAERMERLKTPIRIPQFGTDQPLHERLEPYRPPLRPQGMHHRDDGNRRR